MKTLEWVKSQELKSGGLAAWPGMKAYPEVTGYMIPTLLAYGEVKLADHLADWLENIQHPDGSFNGIDGLPRAFDTAACMEGLIAAGRTKAAQKARDWLLTRNLETNEYLWRVKGLLKDFKSEGAIEIRPDTRTHYAAYAFEGKYLLGHEIYHELSLFRRGMQPRTMDGAGSDTCATAQIARLRLLSGLEADAELEALRTLIGPDGSLPHDLDDRRKVLWPCKFYLDAEFLCSRCTNTSAKTSTEDLR